MKLHRSMAVVGTLLAGIAMTLTISQPALAKPNCDVPNPPPVCDPGGPDNPPTSAHIPTGAVDGVQQTTSRSAIHVWGWAADLDQPTTALTVRISIDGGAANSLLANLNRPDVSAAHANFGALHGYDITLSASSAGHNVCVTTVSVGGGNDATTCRQMDDIVGFTAYGISYDTAHAALTGVTLNQLDKVINKNNTAVTQSTTIGGSKSVTNTEGWSDTAGVKVSVSTSLKVGVPVFAEGKITVSLEGSYSYTQNGSIQRVQTFTWSQPVIVPAHSIVEAAVAVSNATVSVPYTMTGLWNYRSGATAPGTTNGVFDGVNSENLSVTLTQTNLDGSPAATPSKQPAATILQAQVAS